MPLASFPVATEKEGFEVRPNPKKALRKGVFRMSPLKFGINFGINPSFYRLLACVVHQIIVTIFKENIVGVNSYYLLLIHEYY